PGSAAGATRETHPRGAPRADASQSPLSFALGVGGAADFGGLTGVAFAPRLWAALLPRDLRFELGVAYFPSAQKLVDSSRGARLSLWAAELLACRPWASAIFSGGPCAGLEVGILHAEALGVRQPKSADTLWLTASAGGFVGVRPEAGSRVQFVL